MADWQKRPFTKVFSDVTSAASKVDQNLFQKSGKFPIIDQGQTTVAGYTNDESLLWRGELPVLIFGDHTRTVKYVDIPFVLGADGTKVLKPHQDIHPRFAYYALKNVNIPSAGYSRHFKFLRETFFLVPPLPEQKRIAIILTKADRLRQLRRYALEVSGTYLQTVFLELFGDPLTNSKKWELKALGDEIASIRYGTGSPPQYQESGIPFIRATNIKRGTVIDEEMVFFSPDEVDSFKKCRVNEGDLIIVRSGVNTGDSGLIPKRYQGAYAAYDLIVELPSPQNVYYNHVINSPFGKAVIKPLSRRAGQPHLNAEQVKELVFASPPLPLQQKFAQIVRKHERLRLQQREAARQAEGLFGALLHLTFEKEPNTERVFV